LETKLGTGASTPTTVGHVLTVTGAGATAYQAGASGAIALGRLATATLRYSLPGVGTLSTFTTQALAATTLYYCPIITPTAITLDQIACEVTTAGTAGATIRLGIWEANTNWMPTTLTLDASTVAADTTGVKSVSISQALAAGRYLLGIYADVAATVRAATGSATAFVHQDLNTAVVLMEKASATVPFPGTPQNPTSFTSGSTGFRQLVFVRVGTP
jgi:hypothetical protein